MPRPPRATGSSRATPSPASLDVAAFCRDGGELSGELPLQALPRLAESVLRCADGAAEPPVQWRAEGSLLPVTGGAPQHLLDLSVRARPMFECQRCLQPVALPLDVRRRVRFVAGEETAARLDEELDDDVLALVPRLDLPALIEDELLLALPLVPRHDECPELPAALRPTAEGGEAGNGGENGEGDARSHPFAALAELRRRKP